MADRPPLLLLVECLRTVGSKGSSTFHCLTGADMREHCWITSSSGEKNHEELVKWWGPFTIVRTSRLALATCQRNGPAHLATTVRCSPIGGASVPRRSCGGAGVEITAHDKVYFSSVWYGFSLFRSLRESGAVTIQQTKDERNTLHSPTVLFHRRTYRFYSSSKQPFAQLLPLLSVMQPLLREQKEPRDF
ncbi:hypothetical protein AOLI_G00085030 [Acnodon oligacanthus]